MELKNVDNWIKNNGIQMNRLLRKGGSGLFWYQEDTYEYKKVYDWELAEKMNEEEGWQYQDLEHIVANVVVNLVRDLKGLIE